MNRAYVTRRKAYQDEMDRFAKEGGQQFREGTLVSMSKDNEFNVLKTMLQPGKFTQAGDPKDITVLKENVTARPKGDIPPPGYQEVRTVCICNAKFHSNERKGRGKGKARREPAPLAELQPEDVLGGMRLFTPRTRCPNRVCGFMVKEGTLKCPMCRTDLIEPCHGDSPSRICRYELWENTGFGHDRLR